MFKYVPVASLTLSSLKNWISSLENCYSLSASFMKRALCLELLSRIPPYLMESAFGNHLCTDLCVAKWLHTLLWLTWRLLHIFIIVILLSALLRAPTRFIAGASLPLWNLSLTSFSFYDYSYLWWTIYLPCLHRAAFS